MSSIDYDIANQTTLEPQTLISKTADGDRAVKMSKDGMLIEYDILTTKKTFEVGQNGFYWTDGVTPYTTSLSRIAAVQSALAAVELPPNATTLKINETLLVSAGIANQTTSVTDGQITINGTGLNANPLLSLNTGTGNGILYQEVYNQRSALTGEFSRMSFNAKNSAGTKTEYARIHQNAPVITSGAVRGRMDFGVNFNGSIQDYLTLNAQTQSVGLGATLDCNNNTITEIQNAFTTNGFKFPSQTANFLTSATGNSTPAGLKDAGMRAVYCNGGVPDSLEAVTGTFPSAWGNILCSATWSNSFGNYFWVGTNTGYLYWTADSGVTWNNPNGNQVAMNAEIRCMAVFNNRLYFGGGFTSETLTSTPTYYIAYLDTNEVFAPVVWNGLGTTGVNGVVNSMVVDINSGSYLYFAGAFTADNGAGAGSLGINRLAIVDTGDVLYDTDGQTTGLNGNGFTGGTEIKQILISAAYTNQMAVCGDFTNFNSAIYGTLSCDNFAIWVFVNNVSTALALYPTFNNGVITLNDKTLSVMRNGGDFYIGGDFTNTYDGASNPLPYWIGISFNGISTWAQLSDNPYMFVSQYPVTKQLHPNAGGLYWTDSAGGLYLNGNQLTTAPFGSTFGWIGDDLLTNLTYFSTISGSQYPITMYYWKTSDLIIITLSNPVVYSNATYSGTIILYNLGSNIELIWDETGSKWFVVSIQSSVGFT